MKTDEKLSTLQPAIVFKYFEEICGIPHGSYNIDALSNYLKNCGEKLQLKTVQDEEKNIIMYKAASKGYEEEPTIILQAHMDMVAVAEKESRIDMQVTPLTLCVEEGEVYAQNTSLGGDDGIGVAMILAVLEDDSIPHPAIEAVFTVNEETGMEGAAALDASLLCGKRLLNIDSEEEGILTVGCAGGQRVEAFLKAELEKNTGVTLELELSGLLGGHSGTMIHLGRANAAVLTGCFVELLAKYCDARFISLEGGEKSNAICDAALLKLAVPEAMLTKASNTVKHIFHQMSVAYKQADPGLSLRGEVSKENADACFDKVSTERVARLIQDMPDGVVAMMEGLEEQVETSLNLGIAKMDAPDCLHMYYELRSNKDVRLQELTARVCQIAADRGCEIKKEAGYPGWEYRPDSVFRDKMVKCFWEEYGILPKVETVHAGLECGLLSHKIPDLEAVSMGPDIKNIHTTKERLNIASTERTYKYLLKVLAAKDEK